MSRHRSSRRRRTLLAACLPYLLLSLFVDFVHLHPLLNGTVSLVSVTQHIGQCTSAHATTHQTPCAICQWSRAGKSLQASVTISPTLAPLLESVGPRTVAVRGSPSRSSIVLRGPPSPRFA